MTILEPITGQLALDGIRTDALGVTVTGPIDTGQVVAAIENLGHVQDAWQWVVGDLANAVLDAADDQAEAIVAIGRLNISPATLANAMLVADTFPRPRRRAGLSWSHHYEVRHAELQPTVADELLDRCVADRLNTHQLRALVHGWREDQAPRLPGMERVPKPPESRVRAILERDPKAWVLWQPATGTVKEAEAAS